MRNMLSPIKLTPQQKELCKRLNLFIQRTKHKQDLSMLFTGAIYATREVCRSNPDWIAQSAHSFREILYPFYSGKINRIDAFKAYGSATIEEVMFRQSLNTVYGKMTDIAHHLQLISTENYEKLIEDFQRVLLRALDKQVDVHNQIDKFLSETNPEKTSEQQNMTKKKPQEEKFQEAKRLINMNEDSRQYFFEKGDETWLIWLRENGFFDVLKEKAEDPSQFSYRMPELRYMVRMVEFKPEVVTEIISDTLISEETFNPEVVDQFLHICGSLPGEYLTRLTGKIKTENWPALMQTYNQWGMEYEKMFESLDKSDCHKEILELASVILNLRDDWKTKLKEEYSDPTPFYLENLSYSKVFHYLSNIDENYIEDVIDLSISVLKNLTINVEEDQETPVTFKRKDAYPLYSVDVFTVGLTAEYHDSGSDDVREVVALVKSLTEHALMQECKEKANAIYEQHFSSLPDSWLMWRIRLFVLSLCPIELMSQLKDALYRIFNKVYCGCFSGHF